MAKVTKILDFCYLCFMILFPPCKINLGLHILGKCPDGYHALDTLMYQLPFTDILELVPAYGFRFTASGLEIPGDKASNLCVKAFRLMQSRYNIPDISIHLHKIIPMGGGLGGGSADAAYTLKGINDLFELKLDAHTLQQLAAELGSDCPLFIEEMPQIAQGRGELLSTAALSLEGYYIKLVNPGIHVSTREAFDSVSFYTGEDTVTEIISQPVNTWKSRLVNSFEQSVFKQYPLLQEIKEALYNEGAVYAAMSGSGSTMFGIFMQKPALYSFLQEEKGFFEQVFFLGK